MTNVEILKNYHAAWASQDGEAFVALMAPDAVFYDIPYGLKLNINEMDSYFHSLYDVCPDLKFIQIESAVCSKGILLLRWELILDNEAGNKKGVRLPGVEVIHIRRGRIYQVECYYDVETENKLIYSKASDTAIKRTTAKPKYIKSGLGPRLLNYYHRNLEQMMELEKPFLDPELTLSELAEKLGITTNHLSQVINSRFGVNFHAYMNRYRIEATKQILQETPEMGVLDAAFQSGFNSVSAFYSAFKKHTGMTPAEFRKNRI